MPLQEQAAPQFVNPTALRAQILDAQARITGLQAQYDRVHATVQEMTGGPGRASLEMQEARISLDVAQVQGELARLTALAKLQGVTPGTVQPPRRFIDRVDPEMVVGLSFFLLLAFVIPMSIGLARRMMRGAAKPTGEDGIGAGSRLDRLEQAVDSIAIEVERISEGQRYVTKLLSETSKARVESDR